MKINNKILSIPPFVSTPWNNVISLHTKDSILFISLKDNRTIEIPGLENNLIDLIFNMHTNFLEQCEIPNPPFITHQSKGVPQVFYAKGPMNQNMIGQSIELPLQFGAGSGDIVGASVFQHDSNQSDTPNIPAEILMKIVAITKIVSPDSTVAFSKPEPHCNCVHCQIGRAMHSNELDIDPLTIETKIQEKEETVSDADLHFQQWEIAQTGEQLFSVVNRENPKEKYNVFLGDPVGCTCGKDGCEHIIAVLKS